jgi:predicted RNA-binding protein with PIN domain
MSRIDGSVVTQTKVNTGKGISWRSGDTHPDVANPGDPEQNAAVDEPRHLLVDGYNILYAWKWLSARDSSAAARANARSRLIEAVRPLHDSERLAITLVFDGRGATTSSDDAATEPGFAVLFAPAGKSADGVIEATVASAPDPRACTVATADALERETVAAFGATCLSPEDLQAWCTSSRARTAGSVARQAGKTRASWGTKLPL